MSTAAVEVKQKKEKSSKKRKADPPEIHVRPSKALESQGVDANMPASAPRAKSTKPAKCNPAPEPANTPSESTESAEAVDVATMPAENPSKKRKSGKEKSSKKRKATALSDDIPMSSEEPAQAQVSTPDTAAGTTTKAASGSDSASPEPPSKKRKSSVEEIEVDITAPEPPSKKALRRLKKGKPLPPSKSGAESTPEPEAKKEKKSEVEKRSEHGVWIGNLPWTASKEDLRKFLVEMSDLTEDMITRVHMPGPDDGKSANKVEEKKFGKKQHNKGFAYVDFSTAEAVNLAVELSEQLLSGRRVLIKNNKSFEGRPQKTKEETRNEGKPPSKRVFLGNLSFDTTEDSIKEHFEKCGPIDSVKVATFEDTGKCKGYAWVVFEELEAAQSAVRGFVRIEEEASDQSGSEEENSADSDTGSGSEEVVSRSKPKKMKTRKWWVNRIKGRPLRMEFAEDAQVRYKKRYGKDGTKKTVDEAVVTSREDIKDNKVTAKVVEYRKPYAARLTGGIVESKGKKTTF